MGSGISNSQSFIDVEESEDDDLPDVPVEVS